MGSNESAELKVLRVRASSDAGKLASAIAHAVYEERDVMLRAIGAGAVNQSVKALAIARGYVASKGFSLAMVPGFTSVKLDDNPSVSALNMRVIVSQQ